MSVIVMCSRCGKEIDKYRNKYITYYEKNTNTEIKVCINCALDLLEKTRENQELNIQEFQDTIIL
ncbi:DNA-directed RNA polymerase [Clostridioides difficile]|nr:DNA-directed RNA polymerase [Clostridioides difficile]EGT2204733.1 DNA-directed RNA polymerase [Clostridioides difficile]EGT4668680.1 DNA-directed RNA polymerase [Clostridioides difficile]EGT4669170.1 DNA-directed RNA polymerase [Clostridioides difficile]